MFKDGKLELYEEGEYLNGLRHGHFVYVRSDGGRFEGEFQDGKYNGAGTYTWADGRRLNSVWRHDTIGKVTYTYINGDLYEGGWASSDPNGKGTLTLKSGETFSGTWSNGCFRQGNRTAWVATTARECGFQ